MVPLIEWLNSFDSITTAFCCQGEPRKPWQRDEDYICNRPYVLFTCIDPIDLITVLSVFGYYATVEVSWSTHKAQIEYTARFTDQDSLFNTIDYIIRHNTALRRRRVHRN